MILRKEKVKDLPPMILLLIFDFWAGTGWIIREQRPTWQMPWKKKTTGSKISFNTIQAGEASLPCLAPWCQGRGRRCPQSCPCPRCDSKSTSSSRNTKPRPGQGQWRGRKAAHLLLHGRVPLSGRKFQPLKICPVPKTSPLLSWLLVSRQQHRADHTYFKSQLSLQLTLLFKSRSHQFCAAGKNSESSEDRL